MVQVEEADYCKPYPPAEWSTILDNDANTGYEGCRLNANSTESFVVGEGILVPSVESEGWIESLLY